MTEKHDEQDCPSCGSTMRRLQGKGVTKCSGEWRHTKVVRDYCDCGIRILVSKEIGEPL